VWINCTWTGRRESLRKEQQQRRESGTSGLDDTIPPRRAKGNRARRANRALNRAESNGKSRETGDFALKPPLQGVNRAVKACAAVPRKCRKTGQTNSAKQTKREELQNCPIFKGWRVLNMAKLLRNELDRKKIYK